MNVTTLTFGLIAVLTSAVAASADPPKELSQAVTIPLDQIWANHMPGTRDIRELEPEQRSDHLESLSANEQRDLMAKRLWFPTALSLCADSSSHWPREGQTARPAFAVKGMGRTALEAANRILAKGEKPASDLSADEDISLIFFSYQFGAYVEIQNVDRRDNTITIRYRLIRPVNQILTAHLALIPLGKSPIGQYQVKVVQEPSGQEMLDGRYESLKLHAKREQTEKELGRRFVSTSFNFSVSNTQGSDLE